MNRMLYKELTIGFLVLIAFCMSVALGYLSHKVDKIDVRISSIEQSMK